MNRLRHDIVRTLFSLKMLLVVAGAAFLATDRAVAQPSPEDSLTLTSVVRISLAQNPSLRLQQRQVDREQGRRYAHAGAFDVRFRASAAGNRTNEFATATAGQAGLRRTVSNGVLYQVGIPKLFRSGLEVEPYLQVERTSTLQSGQLAATRADIGIGITYPLMQGHGADEVAAELDAARKNFESSELLARATASATAYEATTAFWRYVAERKTLEIVRQSEERAATLLDETRMLVERGERPMADLDQPRASLSKLQAQRIGAEQVLDEALRELSIVMGIDRREAEQLAIARVAFPAVDTRARAVRQDARRYVSAALERRDDFLAVQRSQQAADILLEAAADRSKPRLDLVVDAGYAGLGRGNSVGPFLQPFGQEASGFNASITLSTDVTFRNRTAKGLFLQQRAASEQQAIRVRDLERTIRISVETTLDLLSRSVQQLEKSRETVRLYQSVVENEKRKYRMGSSTLFDVILAEDRLTSALSGLVDNERQYAVIVARLRFETGTLLQFDGGRTFVERQQLTTVPLLSGDEHRQRVED